MKKAVKNDSNQSNFKSVLLYQRKSSKKEKLIEVYKKDRVKARVLFENGQQHEYQETSYYVFEYDNKDFRLVKFINNISFSKNNIIYIRKRTEYTIIYKHESKSFYFTVNNSFKPLTVNLYKSYINITEVSDYIIEKFGWVRNCLEISEAYNLTLTTILKKKLFSKEKIIKHIYGVNHNVAKVISESCFHNNNIRFLWKKYKHLFFNLDKLRPEFLNNHILFDACRFAQSFGEKINCAWGEKRLKQFHDVLYKKHIDIILEFEPLSMLNISEVYLDFAAFSGYKILKTNHDLISEGKKQSHCVGTYSSNVNSGNCAIYSIGGYTLELKFGIPWNSRTNTINSHKLFINQFRGYNNCDAPKLLYDELNWYLDEFNKDLSKYTKLKNSESIDEFIF